MEYGNTPIGVTKRLKRAMTVNIFVSFIDSCSSSYFVRKKYKNIYEMVPHNIFEKASMAL